jgi:hypothetical protein
MQALSIISKNTINLNPIGLGPAGNITIAIHFKVFSRNVDIN